MNIISIVIIALVLCGCATSVVTPPAIIKVPNVCKQPEELASVLKVQKRCLVNLIDNHNKNASKRK